MLASMAGFVVNDTFVKLASAEMAAPQIMALRGAMATLLLFALARWRGAFRPVRTIMRPIVLLRTAADIGATLSYITALGHLPIANTTAIFQALPLTVTVGAAVFLKEPVGWRRWTATGIGFLGVMIIVRPGLEGFTAFSLYVLASVVFAALRDLATRRMPRDIPSLYISMTTALAVTLTGGLLAPFYAWAPVEARHVAYLAFAAIAIGIGYICIVEAMRVGEMGFVAPFRYSILIYALLIGLLVFGETPDGFVIAGSLVIVASGAYTLYRERMRSRAEARAGAGP